MNARPFLRSTVVELEDLFATKRADTDTLNALKTELQFRNVPRATALLTRVKAALSGETALIPPAQPALFLSPSSPQPSPSQSPQPHSVVLPKPILKSSEKEPGTRQMALDEAYKVLRVTEGTSWEQVEQARAKIVQRSHPDALEGLNSDKRAAMLTEARRANAAYAAIALARRSL